jgi:hypothetical protein
MFRAAVVACGLFLGAHGSFVSLVLAQGETSAGTEQAVGQREAAPQQVKVEGMFVQTGFNTDWQKPGEEGLKSELDGVIEGAVSFAINLPFEKLSASLQRPEALGSLSANIEDYKVQGKEEAGDRTVYHIEETLVPFPLPGIRALAKKKIYVRLAITTRAPDASSVALTWELEPGKPSGWQRFSGSLHAMDLHTGYTLVVVRTSTRSGYTLPASLRLQLASRSLAGTRDNLVKWLSGL